MKKLIALIIAIIALIEMNTTPTKPAEKPIIEPTNTIIKMVKKNYPKRKKRKQSRL
ncbi:MAG: hypothetical protein KBS52_00090 [Clostridiales bacterium]|nr:hypothetical protein [Candidatus Equinaster intestinalis]